MDLWEADNAATALTPHATSPAHTSAPGHSAIVDPRITTMFMMKTAVATPLPHGKPLRAQDNRRHFPGVHRGHTIPHQ